MADTPILSERHKREIEYHRANLDTLNRSASEMGVCHDVLRPDHRRWWNPGWAMYTPLLPLDLRGKTALVVGCGLSGDPILLAHLGADVIAFDLSPDLLALAKLRASSEQQPIAFLQHAAENIPLRDNSIDLVFARDILHHCDVSRVLREIERVAKPGAILVVNEMYTHSWLQSIRNSSLVDRVIYPRLVRFVYGGEKPYITNDERKLDEQDVNKIVNLYASPYQEKYFGFVSHRLIPGRFRRIAQIDRLMLSICPKVLARMMGGSVVLYGTLDKGMAASV